MCDSTSDDDCSKCLKESNDNQCCSLCLKTNERCKRKAEPGLSRCLQHHKLCKEMYNEYKDLCKDLLETDFNDLSDEEFIKKYKDLVKCVEKRREQSRICYPFHDNKEIREKDYKGCYVNPEHDIILKRYDHKIKKFKTRFDKLKNKKEKEYKQEKKEILKNQFDELNKLEKLRELVLIEKNTPKKEEKKILNPKKKKKSPKVKSNEKKKKDDLNDILKELKKESKETEKYCKEITENGKLCYDKKDERCKDYCIKNCSVWMKELFKNIPDKIKFEFKDKDSLVFNINTIIIYSSNNTKIANEAYYIDYEYPYNSKKKYALFSRDTSQQISINHDQLVKKLCNNVEDYLLLAFVFAIDRIDSNSFINSFNFYSNISFPDTKLPNVSGIKLVNFIDTNTLEFELKLKLL